jgi:cytochrome c
MPKLAPPPSGNVVPATRSAGGSPIGGNSPRYGYRAALQDVGGDWTRERMDAWLANPQRFAPGTSMRFPGVGDPLVRADLIAYLETQK